MCATRVAGADVKVDDTSAMLTTFPAGDEFPTDFTGHAWRDLEVCTPDANDGVQC